MVGRFAAVRRHVVDGHGMDVVNIRLLVGFEVDANGLMVWHDMEV